MQIRIKSDNFTRNNKEKSNIVKMNDWMIISYFGGSNNIFADYICYMLHFFRNFKMT